MIYEKKAKIIKAIRNYFDMTGAVEVFTDILREYPNLDTNIYPLEVYFFNEKGEKKKGFLHTSPEYEMKKILSHLKKDIYQITKVFRNYEGSQRHKTEFTMLEWYRVGYTLEDLMEDTKNIFIQSAIAIYKKTEVIFSGRVYDFSKWEKISVDDAFYRYTGVYPDDFDGLLNFLSKSNIKHENLDKMDWETAFFTVYAFYVEPELGKEKPTFIYDYPPEMSALSKIENGKGKRFEAYVNGLELVNGYYEETNWKEVEKVLLKDLKRKKEETGKDFPIDKDFLKSLKNMPDCSGASLGIDRLLMVLLNKKNINEV